MQYIEYVRLGLMGIGLLMELVRDLRDEREGTDEDSDATIDKGVDFLSRFGEIAKIKELRGESMGALVPEIKTLVKQIAELRKASKPVA